MFEVVDGADVTDGATSGAHEDGVGGGLVADKFYSRKERALDDTGSAKNSTFARDDMGRSENRLNFFFGNPLDFAGFGLGIGEPHTKLNFTSQGTECGCGENAFGGASDADIEIDARIGEGRGDSGGDIAIGDSAQGGASAANGINEGLIACAIENKDHEIADPFMENFGEALEGLFEGCIEKVRVGILFLKEAGDGGTIGDFVGVVAGKAPHERLVGAFGNFGGGHDRDGVGGAFRKVGGAVDWIEGDIKSGSLGSPFAESIAKKNTWGGGGGPRFRYIRC